MNNNPILDELRAVREKLLADAGGTLDALVDRIQADERKSDRPRYKPPQRTQCVDVPRQKDRPSPPDK